MAKNVRIALDAMGGDHGPSVVLGGADISLARHPDTEFLLFGAEGEINPLLARYPRLQAAARVIHTDVVVRWTTSRARRCAMAAGSPRCG